MRLKKRFALAAALLLLAAVLPLGSMKASAADYSFVRVKLSTPNVKSITMSVKGAYLVKEANRLFTDGTLTVSASGSTVSVSHSAEGALYSGGTVTLERVNLSRDAGYLRFATSCGTRMYLGHFSITASGGLLSIVNRVPMTHYLYGVVGHEMSDSFPLEALKAQAVTARCYALRSIRSSGAYDILDTSEDQVYKGYTSTYYNVIAAVDAVADVALYYNNDVMICYYSASNGGYMLKPSSVWSGASPYDGAYTEGPDAFDMKNPASPRELIAIPTAFFPNTVKPAALYNLLYGKLAAAAIAPGAMPDGYSFSALLSIDNVVSAQSNGSISGVSHTKATVNATVIATIDHIPETPAPTATPTPTPTATPTATPTEAPTPTPTSDPSASPDASASPDSGETPTPAPTETPTPTPTAAPTATPVPLTVNVPVTFSFEFAEVAALGLYQNASLRVMYAVKTDAGFALQRCRYGHGVGMSQRGAEQMANEGKTYQEILAYYYGGSRLGTMAAVSPESGPSATSAPTLPGTQATGTVTGEAVYLRKNPTTSSEQLAKLTIGTKVVLTGLFGDWYQVSVPDKSLSGYCHGKYITPTGDGVIARGYVNAAAVNYRSGPGTSYGSLGKLSKSTQLGIYGLSDGWFRVLVPDTGKSGYVSQSYVTVTDKAVGGGTSATPTPTAAPATPTPAGATPTPTPAPTATPTPTPMPTPAGPYTADGTINAAGVNIRKGASTSTQSYGKLDKGEKLGVYEKVGSWYSVKVLSTGKTGYVYAKYVTIAPSGGAPSTASAGTINASAVNIRKGPSTSYTSLGRLNKNTKVSVLASEGSWYKVFVSSTGTTGYVFNKYVTLSSTSSSGAAKQGVVTALLNLRTLPAVDSSSRVLATMERGAVVTVHSTANGWCFVTYNGTTGYCIASCVEVG